MYVRIVIYAIYREGMECTVFMPAGRKMTSLALSSAPGSPTSMTSLKMQRFANFSVGSFSSSLQPLARERTNSVEASLAKRGDGLDAMRE